MDESYAGDKEIENPSISPNQDEDVPTNNHDNDVWESSTSKGWSIELKHMPLFTEKELNDKLINNAETMPDNVTPKAHRNKRQGYKLWKEGYVSNVRVKPKVYVQNVKLFLVKATVSASMKNQKYTVYCHLDQTFGDVRYAKCNCKAGQGGCRKHVAALLYTLLDFSNLSLLYVPEDVTCTQVLQKRSIPSQKLSSNTAVKFNHLEFEKTNFERDNSGSRKRPKVMGNRENFCATPLFAKNPTTAQIQAISEELEKAGKASILVATLKGNSYNPCNFFYSCNEKNDGVAVIGPSASNTLVRPDIFSSMLSEIDLSNLCVELAS